MKNWWWKILTIGLLLYVVLASLLMQVPRLAILNETIRALHYHVPMWFGMIILLAASMVHAVRCLRSGQMESDIKSVELANMGLWFGVLGLISGMIWANFTWGSPWSSDPKQNATAIAMLIYLAYFVLRGALPEEQKRARISAVYNIFAFATLIPLLFILPRLTDSLHPGNGGNPGFNAYDLDSKLRVVFYPAVIAFTLLGFWLASLRVRYRKLVAQEEESLL